jgi:hypothetical protein
LYVVYEAEVAQGASFGRLYTEEGGPDLLVFQYTTGTELAELSPCRRSVVIVCRQGRELWAQPQFPGGGRYSYYNSPSKESRRHLLTPVQATDPCQHHVDVLFVLGVGYDDHVPTGDGEQQSSSSQGISSQNTEPRIETAKYKSGTLQPTT